MRTSEIIQELERLINKHGDRDFHVYLSHSKENREVRDICFDHSEEDIYVGVYA